MLEQLLEVKLKERDDFLKIVEIKSKKYPAKKPRNNGIFKPTFSLVK